MACTLAVTRRANGAHTETEHFARLVLGHAVPRLGTHERTVYETLDPA